MTHFVIPEVNDYMFFNENSFFGTVTTFPLKQFRIDMGKPGILRCVVSRPTKGKLVASNILKMHKHFVEYKSF